MASFFRIREGAEPPREGSGCGPGVAIEESARVANARAELAAMLRLLRTPLHLRFLATRLCSSQPADEPNSSQIDSQKSLQISHLPVKQILSLEPQNQLIHVRVSRTLGWTIHLIDISIYLLPLYLPGMDRQDSQVQRYGVCHLERQNLSQYSTNNRAIPPVP